MRNKKKRLAAAQQREVEFLQHQAALRLIAEQEAAAAAQAKAEAQAKADAKATKKTTSKKKSSSKKAAK